MVPYKPKVMHVEDDILNFSPIIHNINFYMTSTHVTLSYLVIYISVEISFRKVEIRSYPLYTLVVQNTGYTQEKQKLPQMLPLKKNLKD